jgi:adenosylhomocysteine nucleosidase
VQAKFFNPNINNPLFMNTRTIFSFQVFFCISVVALFFFLKCHKDKTDIDVVVLISANSEWKIVTEYYPDEKPRMSTYGEFFKMKILLGSESRNIVFFHGGWGKVAAAGSTQYCIDKWHPDYIINLGTCGGFKGFTNKYDIILVDKTIIYDIAEAMGDSKAAIDHYTNEIDLSWLKKKVPKVTRKALMVSADRDIVPTDIQALRKKYSAIAGDWETGAISYVCKRNNQKLLILRGVSDLVDPVSGGEAYSNIQVFISGTSVVMNKLLHDLPSWLENCKQ